MPYQHAILPTNAKLELEVSPEVLGRWHVRYRISTPGYEHRDDWRDLPHCSRDEALDAASAIAEGFLGDFEAQGLF